MIKCCTPDCPDRSPTCHATCERYAKEKAAHDAERQEKAEKQKTFYEAYNTLLDGKNRAAAKGRGHKKVYGKR